MEHWTIFITNKSKTTNFIASLLEENSSSDLKALNSLKGAVLSKATIDNLINEEERHDRKIATKNSNQSLKSMSSGEQKKIVLTYILTTNPDYIVLDNPFDNLDSESKKQLKKQLKSLSSNIILIVLISRKDDAPEFINNQAILTEKGTLKKISNSQTSIEGKDFSHFKIPAALRTIAYKNDPLIHLKNINVSYDGHPILSNINWKINTGDFWQLKGANGSGKTTLLSMITGENSKGYGQELYLFGQKKGSGESIWDIKKKIGYYAPTLTHNFYGSHTIEHMLISGLNDSIGLYKYPTEIQLRLAKDWLEVLGMSLKKDVVFLELPIGQQRLVMVARAMIKHPLLLILDEPTENLDDESASLFVALITKIAQESTTAILFVSHRDEPGLNPKKIFELHKTKNGAVGTILK